MTDTPITIDTLRAEVEAGFEGGYAWMLFYYDTEFGEAFTAYCLDDAELEASLVAQDETQLIVGKVALHGSVDAAVELIRAL